MSDLPEGWVETTLGEVISIQNGYAFKAKDFSDSGTYVVKIKNIASGKITLKDIAYYNGDSSRLENYFIEKGDILVSMTGSHISQLSSAVGKVCVYSLPDKALLNQRVGNIKLRQGVDKVYLSYLLIQPCVQQFWGLNASGSANQANISPAVIKSYEFILPPLPEQKAIADMLSSFDEKIELLREQNKTLETLAQTIFKEWFVHFNFPDQQGKPYRDNGGEMVESELGEIPKGWRVGKLGNLVKTNASSISKNSKLDIIHYLDTGSLTEGHIESTQELQLADAPSRARRIVQHNDVLISTVRPNLKHYGIIKEPDESLIVSTGFCVISSDKIDPHFVYFLLTSNDMTDYLHSIAEGSTSTYPSIKPSDIEKIEFVIPSENALKLFSGYADKAWNKIMFNQMQIKTLSKTRDILLPKLMSGQVRVQNEEELEELCYE